jgi:hypothetical protein
LLHLKNKKGGIVRASQGDLACVSWHLALWESSKELRQKSQDQTVPVRVGIWPCEKTPRNWGKSLRTRHPEKQQCSMFPRWLCILLGQLLPKWGVAALESTSCLDLELAYLCACLLGDCVFASPPFPGARARSSGCCCQCVVMVCCSLMLHSYLTVGVQGLGPVVCPLLPYF